MIIYTAMKIFVVSRNDGSIWETTLGEWNMAVRGGSKWEGEDFVITDNKAEAVIHSDKYKSIYDLACRLKEGHPDDVKAVIAKINDKAFC